MNKIIYKLLLTGDKFMSGLHLKQPRFTYSACEPVTKHDERIKKFRETGNLKHLYRNELDKTCFAHDVPIVKILLRELFQIRFWGIGLLKLLEILIMMGIKEH